jgi:hypothetical protein
VKVLAFVVVSWVMMVLFWPWAHQNPLLNPIESIFVATHFPGKWDVLFEGGTVPSDQLPPHYLLKSLIIGVPPAVLVLAIIGAVATIRRQFREPGSTTGIAAFCLELWFFAPLVLWTVLRPNLYDGFRHFLFLLPALAIWASLGIYNLYISGHSLRWRVTIVVTCILLGGWQAYQIVTLHPYQMTYLNVLVGGLRQGGNSYETDYWVTSYREAAEWISAATADTPSRSVKLLVAIVDDAEACISEFLPDRVSVDTFFSFDGLIKELPQGYDYYVSTTRFGLHKQFANAPIVHTIGRHGATFCVIRAAADAPRQHPRTTSGAASTNGPEISG